MMAGRVTLEPFELEIGAFPPGAGMPDAECAALAGDVGLDWPSSSQPDSETETDPEAERIAFLGRIANALETIAAEQADLRASYRSNAAAAFGNAAASLLPNLARTGFARLVAEMVTTAATRGHWPELRVSLAPDHVDEIATFLAGFSTSGRVRLDADPDMPPGEAAVAWTDGGAELDADSLARSVLDEYRRKLDGLAQTGA